jgi:hypothetical protein
LALLKVASPLSISAWRCESDIQCVAPTRIRTPA